MMRVKLSVLVLSLASAVFASGQEPQLGQARSEVLKLLGQPSAIYSPRFSKFYETSERDIALASAGFVSDIYTRFYGGIEFSVSIGYWSDESASRLHPTERVTEIEMTPDKNLPFIQLASLLPYTKEMCGGGCKLLGTLEAYSYEVFIYPKFIRPEQQPLSASIANHFSQSPPSASRWTSCIKVSFKEKAAYRDEQLPKFNSLTVDTIVMTVFDPASVHIVPRQPVKEGEWIPESPSRGGIGTDSSQ